MMKEMDFREIANAKIASRVKQVGILMLIIAIGILISIATQAQPPRHFKAKFACNQLSKKRNQSENMKVLRVATRKVKYKPMAEVEAPQAYRTTARVDKADKRKKS